MKKLFSEDFGIANTDQELEKIAEVNPGFSRAYLAISCGVSHKDTKEWIEMLWEQYNPYADKNFLVEVKGESFHQKSWEMYLACTFLNKGFVLEKKSAEGPDCKIITESGDIVWIEAVAPTAGDKNNKVETIDDILSNYSPGTMVPMGGTINKLDEPKILRITSGIREKFLKYSGYLEKGIIQSNDHYIIAVNGAKFDGWFRAEELILGALFGVGNMYFKIDSKIHNIDGPHHQHRPAIINLNKTPINTNIFLNEEYKSINAIIYCGDNIINSPAGKDKIGNNFIFISNPFSSVPENLFNFGSFWKAEDLEKGSIKKIR